MRKPKVNYYPTLHRIAVQGDWSALLECMPGWRRERNNIWTGSGALLEDNASLLNVTLVDEFRNTLIDLDGSGRRQRSAEPFSMSDLPRSSLIATLNHVAVNLSEREGSFVQSLFPDISPVLDREARFDPSADRCVQAAHFVIADQVYITERYLGQQSIDFIDHIGFSCHNSQQVDFLCELVRKIGWIITVEPQWVDGSYLFHFVGPDLKVHDFFFVGEQLKSKAAKLQKKPETEYA